MKCDRKAVAVAVGVVVATAAAMFVGSTGSGSDRKTAGADTFGDKVLEMLFCVPATRCGDKHSTAFFAAGAIARSTLRTLP